MNLFFYLTQSSAPRATILIRVLLGTVFLTEGLQKFLLPDARGAGRFAKIGIPFPDMLGPFVGGVEMVCGALVLLGLLTRLATLPLISIMLLALFTTKLPILLGMGFWGFSLKDLPSYGFLSMTHEARTDLSMLLCSIFLFIVGSGPWSLDTRWSPRFTNEHL